MSYCHIICSCDMHSHVQRGNEGGYENFTPDGGGIVLHNVSLGLDTPGGLAAEGHAYYGTTTKGW